MTDAASTASGATLGLSPRPAPRQDNPVRGGLLLMAAYFCYCASDIGGKFLTRSLPSVEIPWMRFGMNLLLMLPWVVRTPAVLRSAQPRLQILRGLGLLTSAVLHQVDAHTRPRSRNLDHFIAPLIVTALSIPILHEKVGIRRWGAIAAGLAGMVIIVRPGAHGLHPASILPVIGALGSAVAVIITRRMAGRDSVVTTTVWMALVGFAVLSLMVAFDFEPLTPQQLALGAYVGIASTAGQWLMTLSFSFADASILAPIPYTQILWSTLLGAVVFGNLPRVQTCAGGGVIVVGGIYTAHRERMARNADRTGG